MPTLSNLWSMEKRSVQITGYRGFRSVVLAGITGSILSTSATEAFAKSLVCFNVIDIMAKALFQEDLREISEGALGLCSGNISCAWE